MVRPPTTCGCSSTAERQPSKLVMWVRFPSLTPGAEPTRPPALAVSCGTISSLRCVARPPGHMHPMLHGGAGLYSQPWRRHQQCHAAARVRFPPGAPQQWLVAGAIVALSFQGTTRGDASPDDAGRWGSHTPFPQGAALGTCRKGPLCWRSSMAEQMICNHQVGGSSPFASFHTRRHAYEHSFSQRTSRCQLPRGGSL